MTFALPTKRSIPDPCLLRNKGAALLVMLLIVAVTLCSILVTDITRSNLEIQRQKSTVYALAKAKEALLAWSASRGELTGTPRPGELPCPDTSDPISEQASYGQAASSCTSGKIGRLPWKTLGIPEPLDAYGEPLWYAIDGAFRTTSSLPINSDTRASMQVFDNSGIALLTPSGEEAAAVLFSAGPAIGNQSRNSGSERKTASNYLEGAFEKNNANTGGPFIHGPIRDANGNIILNDQTLIISGRELISTAERRVAGEVIKLLASYKQINGYYPYPANYNATGCTDVDSGAYSTDCKSSANICRGRFPDNAEETTTGLPNWDFSSVPNWFLFNLWGQTIYYAVGSAALKSPSPAIQVNCSSTLTIGTKAGVAGILITAGTPKAGKIRSKRSSPTISQSIILSDYVEDTENQDGWTGSKPSADIYTLPGSSSNDKTYTLP